MLFILIFVIFMIIAQWKIFEKTGRPGWHAIIPIYNVWSLYEVVGLQGWYSLLGLIPFVGSLCTMVFTIMCYFKLAKSFGKDIGFGFGLLFLAPVFMGILAFSKNAVYIGPNGQPMNQQMNQGYNQQMNQSYNQQMNQGYNQPMNQGYNQQMNQGYNQPMNQNYEQNMNQNGNQQFPNNENM